MIHDHIDGARARVRAERRALDAKREAFETFRDRLADLSVVRPSAQGVPAGTDPLQATAGGVDGCQAVRRLFADTVRPHSVADVGAESLLESLRAELGDSVAAALAPTTGTRFGPECKAATLAATDARLVEIETTVCALNRERSDLEAAAGTVESVTDWIARADETPLTALGFDALRDRHERLATHRQQCRQHLRDRQQSLDSTTSGPAEASLRHRALVSYLYEGLPVDYPVLVTVLDLIETCRECQRAVRAHLVRRA